MTEEITPLPWRETEKRDCAHREGILIIEWRCLTFHRRTLN